MCDDCMGTTVYAALQGMDISLLPLREKIHNFHKNFCYGVGIAHHYISLIKCILQSIKGYLD